MGSMLQILMKFAKLRAYILFGVIWVRNGPEHPSDILFVYLEPKTVDAQSRHPGRLSRK
jgi:hypothetical protein